MPDYPQLNWEQMYSDGVVPWHDPGPWPPLEALARANCRAEGSVLEVGCGLGSDAVRLASLGYRVTATDLSATAIDRARRVAGGSNNGSNLEFRVEDFFEHSDDTRYDLLFDKGVMLNAGGIEERQRFSRIARERLHRDGRWISVIGNLDNLNRDQTGLDRRGYPRLSLAEAAEAIEPHFEILSVTQELFGSLPENSFMSWVVVSRPRRLHLENSSSG